MLPSVKRENPFGYITATSALKCCITSVFGNGANEPPRYHKMVGVGLPEETQVTLTESPSCTVTVSFRFVVVGAPGVKFIV